MAINLSKKGWNNVLIFSCMFMILLFNYSNDMLMSNAQNVESRPLIANQELIQAIDFNGVEIQRLGASWRVLSKVPTLTIEQPEELILNWKNQPVQVLASSPMLMESVRSIPVVVWIAGQEEGAVFEFFIDDNDQSAYIKDHKNNTWLVHNYAQLNVFIPAQLFTN